MTQTRLKKSESLEVRLTHEVKQAFMSKVAVEGRSASEIVRRSIADYLRGGSSDNQIQSWPWKQASLASMAGLAVLAIYPLFSPASARHFPDIEAARARLAMVHSNPSKRIELAKEFAKEFASQRVFIPNLHKTGATQGAFSILDFDSNGRLSWTEYRQLVTVPAGGPGRQLFQTQDRNRDGWLSENEFTVVDG